MVGSATEKTLTKLVSTDAADLPRGPDAAGNRAALGAERHRHALRRHARFPPALLRHYSLFRRHVAVLDLHVSARAVAPHRATRPEARSHRRGLDLPQPALLRVRAQALAGVDRRPPARRDADLHRP